MNIIEKVCGAIVENQLNFDIRSTDVIFSQNPKRANMSLFGLTSLSTAMVMLRWSVHLTTLFLDRLTFSR